MSQSNQKKKIKTEAITRISDTNEHEHGISKLLVNSQTE